MLDRIEGDEGSLEAFVQSPYGFVPKEDGISYTEWAPGVVSASLVGDFNDWDRESHPMVKDQWGKWHLFIPGRKTIPHGSKVKISMCKSNGERIERIPAWIHYCKQDPTTHLYEGKRYEQLRGRD